MKTRKIMITLLLILVCLVSGCSTTQNQSEKSPIPKQTAAEVPAETAAKSDAVIEFEKEENSDISSDANLQTYSFVANKNTKKFHFSDCVSVKQMKESNKEYLNCTRDEAVSQGYKPCKKCSPC